MPCLRIALTAIVVGLATGGELIAAMIFVRNDPNSVGIIDQHPLARGDALYDTQPRATGRYDRQTDVDVAFDPNRRFDELPVYYDTSSAERLKASLINGGWYCVPTVALALVKYWDADPRFPNLFDPARGDTDRSVIIEFARLMDVDDVTVRGGKDPMEDHVGALVEDILPGLLAYFNARYPGRFGGGERLLPEIADSDDYNGAWGAAYHTAIRRNIPVMLDFPGHVTAGIGFNDEFRREVASHYRLNDPWDARRNISGSTLGRGRPTGTRGVFGGSYIEDLYGPGNDIYDETEIGFSPSGLPTGFHYVYALEDGRDPVPPVPVPEPGTLFLALVAAAGAALRRRARRAAYCWR